MLWWPHIRRQWSQEKYWVERAQQLGEISPALQITEAKSAKSLDGYCRYWHYGGSNSWGLIGTATHGFNGKFMPRNGNSKPQLKGSGVDQKKACVLI
jgi:hypothetical protein